MVKLPQKPIKQRHSRGFTFRKPSGALDWRIVETVAAAQTLAAFASERRLLWENPRQ